MDINDGIKAAAALAPLVSALTREAERSGATGTEKRAAVMELAGAIYEGARRTGALDGVKETRGLDWTTLAPLVGLLVDGLVALFNRLRLFASRQAAK